MDPTSITMGKAIMGKTITESVRKAKVAIVEVRPKTPVSPM